MSILILFAYIYLFVGVGLSLIISADCKPANTTEWVAILLLPLFWPLLVIHTAREVNREKAQARKV